jgi:CHAT domain-containing protein
MDLFERGVSYIPSCTYLLNTIDRLQISDPEHIGQDESSTPNIIGFVDKSLDFSDVEVGAISKHFSNSIFVEDFLQGVYLLSVSAGYYRTGMDYIHFACHGYFNPEDPSLSALLSQKSGLRLKDLAHDYQNYRLATLSACETGITDLEDLSSDYVSLASAFLHKSCSNVVCSLWRVDNLSTALMMIKFYDNIFMNSKTTIPVALKNAQYWLKDLTKIELENWISKKEWNVIQLKKLKHYMPATNVGDYDKPFASPFFWSGFYAIGME